MNQFTCLVKSCPGHSAGNTSTPLFLIPSGYDSTGQKQDHLVRRRMAWLSALTKRNLLSQDLLRNGRVCGRHFITGRPSKEDLEGDPDWVPSQELELGDEPENESVKFFSNGTGTGTQTSETVIESMRGKPRCYACKRRRKAEERYLVSYHLFPKNQEVRNSWLKFVNKREGEVSKSARLCTRHFTKDQTFQAKDRLKLKRNAVPTLEAPKQKCTTKRQSVATPTVSNLNEITITPKKLSFEKYNSNLKLTAPITSSSTVPVPVSASAAALEEPPELRSAIERLHFPFVTIKEERLDRDYESPDFVTESDLIKITTDVDFQPVKVKEEIDVFETSNNDLIEVKDEPLFRESSAIGREAVAVNGDLIRDDASRSPIKRGVSLSERVDVNPAVGSSPKDDINDIIETHPFKHDHTYCSKIQRRKRKKKIQFPSIVKLRDNQYYKCSFCTYHTEYKSFLVSHLNRAHCHEENVSEPDENGRTWQPGARIFCPYCKNTFKNEDDLMQHMLIHHLVNNKLVQKIIVSDLSTSGAVYNCPYCLLRSTDEDKLTEHIRKKHSNSYQCSDCSYMCLDQDSLLLHSKVHYKGYKFFRCADCLELQQENLMAVHRCNSTTHLLKPTDEEVKKQLKGKMTNLMAHWDVSKVRFECPGCNYTADKQDSFKEHLLAVHTKVLLRYYCNSCMFHSERKCDVNMHRQNTHEISKIEHILNNARTYSNNASSSANDTNDDDANTVATIAPDKKPFKREFKCRFCGYTTKLRFYLNQHMKQQHLSKQSPIVIKSENILMKKKPIRSLPPTKTSAESLLSLQTPSGALLPMKTTPEPILSTKTPLSQNKISPVRPVQSRFEDYIKVVSRKNPGYVEGDLESTKNLTMYRCSLCAYCNRSKKDTEKHLKLKHTSNEVTYACPFCALMTKYKNSLQVHLNSKHLQELTKGSGVKVKVVSVIKNRKENQFRGSNGNKLIGIKKKKKQEARVRSIMIGRKKRVSKPPDRLDL